MEGGKGWREGRDGGREERERGKGLREGWIISGDGGNDRGKEVRDTI